MPMLQLTYPAEGLSVLAKRALPSELAELLLRAERAPDTPFTRSITWAYLHELPADAVLVAGAPATAPTFRLEVTIPKGSLSPRRKSAFATEATAAIVAATGAAADPSAGARVWILFTEFDDGYFARAGALYDYTDLVAFARSGTEPALNAQSS